MPRLLNYTKPDVAGYKAIGATLGFGQLTQEQLFPGGMAPTNIMAGNPFPGGDIPSNQMIASPMQPSTIQLLSNAVSSYFQTPAQPPTSIAGGTIIQPSWISTNWPWLALGGLVALLISQRR